MSEFHKLIANLRDALEHPRAETHNGAATGDAEVLAPVPTAKAARRVELALKFARELEALSGRFLGTLTQKESIARILDLAAALRARSVAVGEGIVGDSEPLGHALERAGIEVIRTGRVADEAARAELRGKLAQCTMAVVEADYGIAATGTLAMLATPERPASLTLLPPVNVILVGAARILPDLAAVLAEIGPETLASHRLALVTGPSRTADIEKRIVLGVHGPREVHVAALWQADD
ncbi:MAG TPA: lactate utilization protein [Candidatus Binataceae bacterium]|nr:lactate utilization protein [Candidatus Binataceae bacterium]